MEAVAADMEVVAVDDIKSVYHMVGVHNSRIAFC